MIRRNGAEASLNVDVRPLPEGRNLAVVEHSDAIWDSLGLKITPASGEDVSAVNPKLRGASSSRPSLPQAPSPPPRCNGETSWWG